MAQLQRIATLILIAFFVLQVLAAVTPAAAEPENKALEATAASLEKTSTAPEQHTTSQAVIQADTKEEKPKEVMKDEKPKDEKPKEESPKEEKPKEDPKPIEQKVEEQKPEEQKPTEEKPVENKPTDIAPAEQQPITEKPDEQKPTDIAPAEQQPITEKPDEQKPTDIAPQQDPTKPSFHKSEHDDTEHEEHHEDHQEEHHEEHEDDHDHQTPYDDYKGEEIDQYLDSEAHEHDPYGNKGDSSEDTTNGKNKTVSAVAAANATAPAVHHAPQAEINGCRTQGQIALTYSEGPSDITAKIVRQLTKADARANFFVNATWLYTQQYAMVVQNIYKAGHFIGMTYRAGEDSLTDDQVRQDVINNARIIEGLIGLSPKYVRLHYTENKDVRTERILQELGFLIVGYNLDSLDYFKKDATGPGSVQKVYEDTFVKYKDTYDAKGSFISIQYDLPYTGSLAAIPHVINTIEQEGYTMVRLDGCLNDPLPYKKTANGTEYVSDMFSFGQSKYHQGQKSVVIETPAEAAAADEEFHMQELDSSANTQQVYSSLFLGLVAATAVSALVF